MAGVAIGAGALGAAGSVIGGFGRSAAMKREAADLEYQAKQFKLRGAQLAHSRRQDFGAAISAMRVDVASRNLREGTMAQLKRREVAAFRETTNENSLILSEELQGDRLKRQAAARRRAAPFAAIQGVIGAASSLSSGFSQAASIKAANAAAEG